MIAIATDLEPVLAMEAELGEGPVWDPRTACLYFVDIMRGYVHQFAPATGSLRTYHVNQPASAIALTEGDDLVLAVGAGFARLNLETGAVRMIAEVEADRPDHRMNDGNCDPVGRFWAGTMALDTRPGAGALYRLEADGRVDTILRNVTISNGIDWSADGTRMFYIDSPTQRIDVFDVDPPSGAIANRRPFVRIAEELGAPDGLTIDADEHVWVALWGGSAVHRYAPDGALDGVMRLPTSHPTSCAFGGADLRDLYITTATMELTSIQRANEPLAGALFRCRPGPAGRPPHRFRG